MTALPLRCVVDTNVTTTANGANPGAPPACVVSSARALQAVMAGGHVFVDDGGRIVAEYRQNLSSRGQPGPGDAFLKWLLTHEWGGEKVTRVVITPTAHDGEDFEELPSPPRGVLYDRSDRKFLAVAAAHADHPAVLQSFDSKWWGWQAYLAFDASHGQWKPLKRWVAPRVSRLTDALLPDLMLFGEWCYAVHTVRYTRLPDWFLAFDVYDRARGEFWSTERRDALAAQLGLAVVPALGSGRFDIPRLRTLLGRSRLTDGPAEGLYLRAEVEGRLVARAKLVRREFVQSLDQHWSRKALRANALMTTPAEDRSWR